MEILAPAGSPESLVAAVRAGADAVYFGAGGFNARRNAKNFSADELSETVSYCRTRGVRAYLTLNTLVSDDEIPAALDVVRAACTAGIDGVIIQDMGLVSLIQKAAPSLPLHASTQMTVHTKSGVEYLYSLGFKRVVLSREISRDELREVAEYANSVGIELEIFVQGALCMSMSGQCLLSAVLGSRSGNRGLCAGPCRLPFSADGSSAYDLSLKDMNLYRYFDEFKNMNIASLKIEGRMKRPEYVAMAVDAAVCARDGGNLDRKLEDLKSIFSRSGFTDGYYNGKIDYNMFGVRSESDIENSKRIMNSAHELYRRERSSVGVDMAVKITANEPVTLSISDGTNSAEVSGAVPEAASNRAVDYETVYDKVKKCGGTPYYLNNFSAEIDGGLAVAMSEINRLKNSALQALGTLREKNTALEYREPELDITSRTFEKRVYISVTRLSQLPDTPYEADMFIVPLFSNIDKIKSLVGEGYNIAVKTPPYFFGGDEKIYARLCELNSLGIEYAQAENLGALNIIKNAGMRIIGGAGLNCYNSYAVNALPLDMAVLSYELRDSQIAKIKRHIPVGINAYGKIPLMLLRNCPMRSKVGCKGCTGKITDRKGISFPLICSDGAVRMYNDRPLYLADRPDILSLADFYVICFTDETPDEVQNVLRRYKENPRCGEPFTRGLYFKGVL